MIGEIFSNEVKGVLASSRGAEVHPDALTLSDLDPIFKKMGLATPDEKTDVVKTSECGYNIMLNQYGAVLRLYPSSKEMGDNDDRVAHGYHPRTIPPIGVVQFDGFTLQLMPGIKHGIDEEDGINAAMEETLEDVGLADSSVCNYGGLNGKAKLLDTVLNMDFSIYGTYADNGVLDRLVEEYKCFEDLQISFHDSWVGDKPFDDFWSEMAAAKESGRLVDGWNNSHLSVFFEGKGNIVDAAKAYEMRNTNIGSDYTL
ncbi:MAG: hypothetical protein COA45_01180 [Zetaproteobacteria bacterium]|nr:MAG: hypothetical protein COA45_01180 [Zetaproteobacteria bacterium]